MFTSVNMVFLCLTVIYKIQELLFLMLVKKLLVIPTCAGLDIFCNILCFKELYFIYNGL